VLGVGEHDVRDVGAEQQSCASADGPQELVEIGVRRKTGDRVGQGRQRGGPALVRGPRAPQGEDGRGEAVLVVLGCRALRRAARSAALHQLGPRGAAGEQLQHRPLPGDPRVHSHGTD
jgi:hypothetical protein